jgi:hypothetical protein
MMDLLELVVHLHPENLHHHKQLAKLQGDESTNNFSFNASIGYSERRSDSRIFGMRITEFGVVVGKI